MYSVFYLYLIWSQRSSYLVAKFCYWYTIYTMVTSAIALNPNRGLMYYCGSASVTWFFKFIIEIIYCGRFCGQVEKSLGFNHSTKALIKTLYLGVFFYFCSLFSIFCSSVLHDWNICVYLIISQAEVVVVSFDLLCSCFCPWWST